MNDIPNNPVVKSRMSDIRGNVGLVLTNCCMDAPVRQKANDEESGSELVNSKNGERHKAEVNQIGISCWSDRTMNKKIYTGYNVNERATTT
jgi:hypothetical protein